MNWKKNLLYDIYFVKNFGDLYKRKKNNSSTQGRTRYLGFCQGGCTFLADPPPPPDLDPHQDFVLDPDPHQNNADPQPWAQLFR